MTKDKETDLPIVAVAGGSGFVGTHLRKKLASGFRFRALTRSSTIAQANPDKSSTEWVNCDLYSLPKVTEALKGSKYGIYLVHSMAPSSRLRQGHFKDLDLLLADNFIRAAEEAGLEHVIYLSGIMPNASEKRLSSHLQSRLEVESVLRSRTIKVTVLRAGIIFGPGGSSFSILINLVRRLPMMIFPSWTHSMTQSIDINDVCRAFCLCLEKEDYQGGTFDLSGHEPMSYKQLVKRVAKKLKRSFLSISIPFNFFFFSKHWLSLLGGVPLALAEPLQKSLIHDLRSKPNPLSDALKDGFTSFDRSFELSVTENGSPKPNPRSKTQKKDTKELQRQCRVRSVQRMPLPLGWNSQQIAREYSEWLTRKFVRVISAKINDDGKISFYLLGRILLLELTPTPYCLSNLKRSAFYISGGCLMKQVEPQGRFEFRLFPESNCLIAAIHGYAPILPWWIYSCTQAILHLSVMKSFSRHLKRHNAISMQ
jgi:nucleoside-diphosphate-sugar epimerase